MTKAKMWYAVDLKGSYHWVYQSNITWIQSYGTKEDMQAWAADEVVPEQMEFSKFKQKWLK